MKGNKHPLPTMKKMNGVEMKSGCHNMACCSGCLRQHISQMKVSLALNVGQALEKGCRADM